MGWRKAASTAPAVLPTMLPDGTALPTLPRKSRSTMPRSGRQVALTDDMIAGMNDVFRLFDTDGSGSISVEEFRIALSSLGKNFMDSEAESVIAEIDMDENGTIDFEEFCNFMAGSMSDQDNEDHLREAFRIFDADGSGTIDSSELRKTITAVMGSTKDHISESELEEMMRDADLDGDGVVDYDEFVKTMMA